MSEEQQHLARTLEQLPYEQREVLVLRYFGDLKFKAIAKSQGVSINTVQGRYRYGLEKLRSLLEEIKWPICFGQDTGVESFASGRFL